MPLPPGPGAPAALQTLQWVRDPERFLRRARERYGPTFTAQLGPRTNVVFVSDPASVREVFHGRSEEMNMGDINGLFRCIMGRTGLLVIDGEDHLRRRKLMLPPFRAARLSEHVPSMLAAASEHVDGWKPGDEFPVSPQMQAITLDVILRAVFGLTPGPRRDYLRGLLSTMLNLVDQPAITLPQLRKRFGGLGRWAKLLRCLDEVDAALYEEIARRRETGPRGESDVLSLLLSDGTLDDVELRDQLLTMLVGGHETTATALAWCFERLVRHPEAMARCVAEVDAGVSHEYVDACIKESLRLRPVLPIAARKVTVPFTVGGREYAPGTVLMVCMYLLHRDPDIYPDPEEFRPERWLDGGPPPYAFVPFGGGVRRCLGAGFASAEMRAVVQTVLRRVTLESVEADGERMIRRSFTLAPRAGGTVRVSGLRPAPRSPAAELATAAEPAKATA